MFCFLVRQSSITEATEELLVHGGNTAGQLTGALRATCGHGYQNQVYSALARTYGGPMPQGSVLITDAGRHPRARHVAHVAVVDYSPLGAASCPTLGAVRRCCANLWSAIEALPETRISVAMVQLGVGLGIGVRQATEAVCSTLKSHRERRDHSVIEGVTLYAAELAHYLAAVETASRYFEQPAESLPAGVRQYLAEVARRWPAESTSLPGCEPQPTSDSSSPFDDEATGVRN